MTTGNVDTRLSYVERQIISLEKDGAAAARLADKFDQTLDKMTETTATIQQLLAVHDDRIRRQYETDLDIYRVLNEHKRDTMEARKETLEVIEKANNTVVQKIEKLDGDISSRFVETGNALIDHDKRIRGLERITFIGLGLAMIIGIIIDKIPFDKIIH